MHAKATTQIAMDMTKFSDQTTPAISRSTAKCGSGWRKSKQNVGMSKLWEKTFDRKSISDSEA